MRCGVFTVFNAGFHSHLKLKWFCLLLGDCVEAVIMWGASETHACHSFHSESKGQRRERQPLHFCEQTFQGCHK